MRQDLMLSFLVHFLIFVALTISAPFKPRIGINVDDIIKVRLTASVPASVLKPVEKMEPVAIPSPMSAEEEVAVVTQTKTIDKAKPVSKPKPKTKAEDKPYKPKSETGETDQAGLKDGQKDVSSSLTGSKLGTASVDNASFDYPYWFVQAFTTIERNWTNPVMAHQPLSCVIYFEVIGSGRIVKVEIEKSSGIPAFDRACERAVTLSNGRLNALPSEFTDEILGIHLEFPYIP